MPPLLGGRYRLDKLIGGGGMGEVWQAHDEVLDRSVAIKIIRPHLAGDENVRARLRVEAQLAGKLHHPGIVDVFDYGEDEEDGKPVPFLVMPLIDGAPLSALLAERGKLSMGGSMAIVSQVAGALHVAHEAGIVHRDLKPGNILVTPDGRVMLVDFGIAHAAGREPLTQTGALIGTADYLSPEQAAGRTATFASDLYSLGVVAYTCLSGTLPFHRDSDIATALAHIQKEPPALPDTVPHEAAALVNALLAKSPSERPSSAAAVAQAAGVLASTMPSAPGHATAFGDAPAMPDTSVGPGSTLPGVAAREADDPATLFDTPADGSVVADEQPRRERPPRRTALFSSALAVLVAAAVGWILLGGGTDTVDVPNVEGKSQNAAIAELEAAGLGVEVRKVDVADAKAGEVVRQTPAAGAEVDKDSVVTVSVATGRVRIPVDQLLGATYEDAVARLDRIGLKATRAFAESDKDAGTVIAVDPANTAKIGSTVTLTVAYAESGEDEGKGNGKGEGKKDDKDDKKDEDGGGDTTPTPSPTTTSPTTSPSTEPTTTP